MNLVLAVLLLLGGVGILLYEAAVEPLRLRLLGRYSWAWGCFLFAAYNLVRWYSTRASADDRKVQQIVQAARARQRADRPRPEPDPTFDFTNDPAPPRPPHETPPSNN